jgi:hypothetical protein
MTLDCTHTRERLADGEPDGETAAHVAGCAACRAIAASLSEIDSELATLRRIDAPDAVVAATIARAELERTSEVRRDDRSGDDRSAAAGDAPTIGGGTPIGAGSMIAAGIAALVSALGALVLAPLALLRWLAQVARRSPRRAMIAGATGSLAVVGLTLTSVLGASRSSVLYNRTVGDAESSAAPSAASAAAPSALASGPQAAPRADLAAGWDAPLLQGDVANLERSVIAGEDDDARAGPMRGPRPVFAEQRPADEELPVEEGEEEIAHRLEDRAHALDYLAPEVDGRFDDRQQRMLREPDTGGSDRTGRGTLDAWRATSGLRFHPRDGWWSNTYVPGDPALRAIHRQLVEASHVHLGTMSPLALAEGATPSVPALAAPTDRAIAVGVAADFAAIEGPTRVRMEVALRAIERAAGRRGAMRIGVVIDAHRALTGGEEARLRAILTALASARSARDRVTITAAGGRGGTLVPLGPLRHGEIEVALRRLLSPPTAADSTESSPVALPDALGAALQAVASEDEIGLVLLLSLDGAHDATLDATLHTGALAGVTTTAVALGDSVSFGGLDAIALAGQGRRRIVETESDAPPAIRAELEAASRLVARAVRLTVRLAPGVQLVEVIGARPLDAEEAARTRAAEQAIDRALAQRLGIGADRDEDDDGVRILIPALYSGDAHAVVLDLLVAAPGPVADVDVRFKDLVRLANGRAQTSLSIARGRAAAGPREHRVIASALAQETSVALADAAALADAGDLAQASARLALMRDAIDDFRAAIPELARDRSLGASRALCHRYVLALSTALSSGDAPAQRHLFAASLDYASHRLIALPQIAALDP